MEHPLTLHKNKELFRQAVQVTAQQMGIPEIYIEKDYWVTYALNVLFNSEVQEYIVFKGGTALSKCFGLIERFSEDIDIVTFSTEKLTENQGKEKVRKVSKVLEEYLEEVNIKGVTNKRGKIRKTAHAYDKIFAGNFKQIRESIILETTRLENHEPFLTKNINSFLGDMMLKQNKPLAEKHGIIPFGVRVLHPERTLCEKIMSLVRFSQTENPISYLRLKVRHIYDLHQMLQDQGLSDFFTSDRFNKLLIKVAQEDAAGFENKNLIMQPPHEAIIFKSPEKTWEDLRKTYSGDFRYLVYGKFPKENEILETILRITKRLMNINWV